MDYTQPSNGEALVLLGLIALVILVAMVFVRNRRLEDLAVVDAHRRVASARLRTLRGGDLDHLERARAEALEREVRAHDERVRIDVELKDEAARMRATADELDPQREIDLRDREREAAT